MPGTRKLLSINRALVLDVLHLASSVPTFSGERVFDLQRLMRLRNASRPRISWAVLFAKAYSLVVMRRPDLRQVFLRWPVRHIYEATDVAAALAIARNHQGEDRLCWGRFHQSHATPLVQLQAALDQYQRLPVEQVFRRQLRLSRLPTWLRRIAWRIGLYVDLANRTRRFGTFSVSSLGREGSLNRTHPSLHTTSLTYGPIDSSGKCTVTLLCDHRVLDGVAAARALSELEAALGEEIASELADLHLVQSAA